jgi:hypothetical protein
MGLTSRETATTFWAIVFLVFVSFNRDVRKSFPQLFRFALNWKVFVPFACLVVYLSIVIWELKKIGIWTPNLLKDTTVWFAFSGIALSFSFLTKDFRGSVIKKLLVNNVKVIVLLEFIIGEYTFSLPVELVLVPIIGIIAALDVIAKTDKKNPSVAKVIEGIQSFFGFLIISFAIIHGVGDYRSLATFDSIRKVVLVPVLSLSLTPYIYLLLLWTSYENLFVYLRMNTIKDAGVRWYAKRALINYLRVNPQRIRKFTRSHAYKLVNIQTKADVDELLEGVR